jgi:hypothetical protein
MKRTSGFNAQDFARGPGMDQTSFVTGHAFARAAVLAAGLVACDVAARREAVRPRPAEPIVVTSPPEVVRAPVSPARRLVLVTVDGVRAEEAFDPAVMPNLVRLVRERGMGLGAPGCDFDVRASGPNFVSLPGYIEMFTGRPTTCTHNACAPVATDTVLDEARAQSAADVAVFASWDKYPDAAARDRSSIVVSAGRTRVPGLGKDDAKLRSLVQAGNASHGYPGWGSYRPDVHTARVALRYLETAMPRVLVLGLGDPDEHAHRGDLPGYRRASQRSDEVIADLERTLARMGAEGEATTVLVTTDHGRGNGKMFRIHGASVPESANVFVAAFGRGVAHRGMTCPAAPLHLADLAGAIRDVLRIEGERGPLAAELSVH